MADKRISDLNLHTSLELSDSLPIINNNETKKTTYGSLYYGIRDGVVSGSQQISDFGFASTGSNIFNGDQTITGSLFISGATELGGNIVPKTARGATLGTLERPFSDIFVSSGSINIASDVFGSPNTSLSNNNGNILVSAGGIRLVEPGNSFIAETGSFQYISGSLIQVGNYERYGDTILIGNQRTTGSLNVSGSTIMIGNNNMTGNTQLTGSVQISGSLDVNGNINVFSGSEFYLAGNKLFNYGQFSDTTTQSGSANTAYAMKLNTTDFAHNVLIESGSRIKVLNTGIYNLQFSSQLSNTANTNITFDIWLAYTGSNVANSNTQTDVNKSASQLGRTVAAWNFMLPIKANDYVELMWSSNASTGELHSMGSQTNPIRPAIPSVITTLTQIG
jgi:hypothetical protein